MYLFVFLDSILILTDWDPNHSGVFSDLDKSLNRQPNAGVNRGNGLSGI